MRRSIVLKLLSLLAPLFVQSCAIAPSGPGLGEPVPWQRLRGWETDHHARAWPALLQSCTRLKEQPRWRAVCGAAESVPSPSDDEARRFFEANFQPHPVRGRKGRRAGLVTGYYEPLLHGSLTRSPRYRYPLYGPPPDLLTLDIGDAYPAVAGRQLRGRLVGRTVKPYPDRAELESDPGALSGHELLWVDDPVEAFFLQVQGSGRVRLPDGRTVSVGFAAHNGRAYRSIGKRLVEMGELDRGEVDLFSIRRWLRDHPDEGRALMRYNPRYIFFRLREDAAPGAVGALGVPLTAGRSLAIDPDAVELGAPVWIETSIPGRPDQALNRLMMAQDTGGAIQGFNRADVFWGTGEEAERLAGAMKQSGKTFVLLPRDE